MEKSVYLVQSIQAYGDDDHYQKAARKLTDAGFVRCRSERETDGKYWEVWLGFPWRLNGALKDAPKERVLSWLMEEVKPGEIVVAVAHEHWGAGVD